jgi:S1-C subfamily serine protease
MAKDPNPQVATGWVTADPAENASLGYQLHFDAKLFPPMSPGRVGSPRDWSHFQGVLLSLDFMSGFQHTLEGSAVLIAPGLALAATHVIEPWEARLVAGEAEVRALGIANDQIVIWLVREVTMIGNTDITLLAVSLASDAPGGTRFSLATISTRLPNLGEKIMVVGFRSAQTTYEMTSPNFDYSGLVKAGVGEVTARYPEKRDSHLLPWPTIEIACSTTGGMSGGPAFDSKGFLIGVLSSSFDAADEKGPSYISLLWPALTTKVKVWWPKGFMKAPASLLEMGRGICTIDRPEAVILEVDPTTGAAQTTYTHWEEN